MKVYLVKAGEWETDIRCVCLTKELAFKECKEIVEEYGIKSDNYNDFSDMIYYEEYEVIES